MQVEFQRPSLWVRWLIFRNSLNVKVFWRHTIVLNFKPEYDELIRRLLKEKNGRLYTELAENVGSSGDAKPGDPNPQRLG
jgi:uncharacterized protein (DUF111 family)